MKPIKLADILRDPAHSVAANMPVTQALERMRRLRISALGVTDEQGHPVGIFTEHDAMLAAYYREQGQEKAVHEVMSSPPLTAPADSEVLPAFRRMVKNGVGDLVVVDDQGRMAGVVTAGGIIRHPVFRQLALSRNVASAMRRDLTTLPADARVEDALRLMTEQRLDCVMVKRGGQLAGLLSARDLLHAAEAGEASLARQLGDVMRQPAATIPLDASLAEAIQRMDQLQVGHLLVSDAEGRFVGLLSEHTIAAELTSEDEAPFHTRTQPATESRSIGSKAYPWLFALLAILLVFASEQIIEHFAQQRELEREKNGVLNQLAAVRARLKGVVQSNLFLAHGLTAVIEVQPDMDQAHFSNIARGLVDERHALRNIAAAPNMVISLVYPLAGNEAALGLDYRSHPGQREAALRARDSGQSVLAGPLPLRQGGIGFVAREPVFIAPAQAGGERRFWGLVSVVFDAETLYKKAGLRDPDLGLSLALRGTDGTGSGGPVFFGDAQLFGKQAVALDVTVPGGSWQLAAMPAKGWGQADMGVDLIRLMGLVAALAAGGMAYRLARNTQALASQSARLRALLNTLPDLIWLKDPSGVFLACNPRFEQLLGARESDIKGQTDHDFESPDLADFLHENDRAAIATGRAGNEGWVSFASDGHRELLETIKTPVYDKRGGLLGILGIARNVTERRQAEEHIQRLNRLYGVLSGISEAVIRLRDPQLLFDEACRIAVEVGGLRMAWLGMVEPDGHEVRPLAHAGVVGQYLEHMHIALGDDERARGPTGRALHAGLHVVCNDIAHDPSMAPWRDDALALGYRASAAFPIRVAGQVRGAFNLYASSAGFFDEKELNLLDDLAEDIGFSLEFIEADRARESLNRRMLDLLESMSEGFISLDREWHFKYVNRKAGALFERIPDELIGKPVWGEFAEGVGSLFQEACERAMNRAETVQIETGFPHSARWFGHRIYPTLDGISIFFNDITERRKQEEELKRLHTTLNALVEGSTDAIFVKDQQGRYLACNQAMSALLGRPVGEILGTDDFALFSAESAERFRADDQRIMQAGETHTYEEPVTTPSATYYYLTTKGPLIIDGEVRGVFGIARDISDRKRAEAALVESESRLRLFIEHAPAALAMFDRDMRYLAVSRRWLTDYHLESSDILGQSHYEVFPDIPERWKAVHRRGLEGELVHSNEDCFERMDGSVQWLRWEVRPWFTAESEVGGIVIFSEDITEHFAAGQALRDSEARFVATFEQAAVGIAIVSPEGRWLRVNRKLCEIVGYDETELKATTFQDITHPDDLDADLDYVRQMLGHEIDHYSMEKRYRRKDGGIIWINLTVALVWKSEDAPDYFISVVEDISARKTMEAALHESESHYRQLFERNPAPMLVYERGSLRLLAVNEAFIQHYGYTRDEARAMRLTDFYPEAEKQRIVDVAARLVGLAYVGEWHHLKKDGSQISIEARSHDLAYEGRAARIAVMTDITERKQAEQVLRDSEARYRSLIEMAPFPAVFSSLRDGSLLYGNHRAERLYGLRREQGIGLPATTFYQDAAQRDRVIAHLRKEGKVDDLEVRMQTVDGQPFWALVSASIVEFKNEPAIFAAINDITARKQMEDDIRQLNAELEDRVRRRTAELAAANRELETFTYSVSHDLKAPLRGIDGYSRLLLEDYQAQLDEPGRQLLGYVRSGVAQMSQLIEDLLTYSRMERRSLSEQTVDLSRLVASVLNDLQTDIQARGMVVDVSLQDLTARADPEGLAIVLRNLVDNALKFSRDSHPPILSISGISREKSITLRIRDNGIGFDMQFHNRIFEIFQRLQRAEDYPGTGVGLAIVHKAMQRMGGRVWAESAPGQGTTFYLELPR